MAIQIKFEDNSMEVLAKMAQNAKAALTAMGIEGTGAVKEQMQNGYGKPIRDTGNLMGSISYGLSSDSTVDIGTNVEYAGYVHEGTYKMHGRPYLKDGLMNNKERLQAAAEEYLKQGF